MTNLDLQAHPRIYSPHSGLRIFCILTRVGFTVQTTNLLVPSPNPNQSTMSVSGALSNPTFQAAFSQVQAYVPRRVQLRDRDVQPSFRWGACSSSVHQIRLL